MVYVQGGTFNMGSTDGQDDEKPVHQVTVSSFYICRYEVTVGEFRQFVNATGYKTQAETGGGAYIWTGSAWEQKSDANWKNPYLAQNMDHPVTCVSWYDAIAYCNWRSRNEGLMPVYSVNNSFAPADWSKGTVECDFKSNGYRLPTEAEWEFAARGGTKSKGYTYSGSDAIGSVAWFWDNANKSTQQVGLEASNELGIYDMSGNVWEWCWDWYDSGYYAKSPGSDPRGAGSGSSRVLRGGAWYNSGNYCRVAFRNCSGPDDRNTYTRGFRLARTP
jgi:formylglycine-generating enzyme required for sulfatase activity